jgi:hypothetical protein
MKLLYKMINNHIQKYNEGFIVLDNTVYTNPTEELIRAAGYKPLMFDEQPEYDIETKCLNQVYEDTEDYILVHWEINDIEFPEDIY